MDETLQELENELKRLTPRRPSTAMTNALERELGTAPADVSRRPVALTGTLSWKWTIWPLAAAAAVAILAMVQLARRPASPRPLRLRLVEPCRQGLQGGHLVNGGAPARNGKPVATDQHFRRQRARVVSGGHG